MEKKLFGKSALKVSESTKERIWVRIQEKVNASSVMPRTVLQLQKRRYDVRRRTKEKLGELGESSQSSGKGQQKSRKGRELTCQEEAVAKTFSQRMIYGLPGVDTSLPVVEVDTAEDIEDVTMEAPSPIQEEEVVTLIPDVTDEEGEFEEEPHGTGHSRQTLSEPSVPSMPETVDISNDGSGTAVLRRAQAIPSLLPVREGRVGTPLASATLDSTSNRHDTRPTVAQVTHVRESIIPTVSRSRVDILQPKQPCTPAGTPRPQSELHTPQTTAQAPAHMQPVPVCTTAAVPSRPSTSMVTHAPLSQIPTMQPQRRPMFMARLPGPLSHMPLSRDSLRPSALIPDQPRMPTHGGSDVTPPVTPVRDIPPGESSILTTKQYPQMERGIRLNQRRLSMAVSSISEGVLGLCSSVDGLRKDVQSLTQAQQEHTKLLSEANKGQTELTSAVHSISETLTTRLPGEGLPGHPSVEARQHARAATRETRLMSVLARLATNVVMVSRACAQSTQAQQQQTTQVVEAVQGFGNAINDLASNISLHLPPQTPSTGTNVSASPASEVSTMMPGGEG